MQPQERVNVTPLGEFIVKESSGTLMGNRGILHDENDNLIKRRWGHKNWVACAKRFKDRRRALYSPSSYTELFFLDEATALATGHRPCWECRRQDFTRFRYSWIKGNPDIGFDDDVPMATIDRQIHSERVDETGAKRTYPCKIENLPDGVMVTLLGCPHNAWLLWRGHLHRWQWHGYDEISLAEPGLIVAVLTPHSIVRAIAAGYTPAVIV